MVCSDLILGSISTSVDLRGFLFGLSLSDAFLHDGHCVFLDLSLGILVRSFKLILDNFLVSSLPLLEMTGYQKVSVDQGRKRWDALRFLFCELQVLKSWFFIG